MGTLKNNATKQILKGVQLDYTAQGLNGVQM